MGNTKNTKVYFDWMADKSLEFFVSYINDEGNNLNGRKLARDIGVHETALRLNNTILSDLNKLKERMLEANLLLPEVTVKGAERSEGELNKEKVISGMSRKERIELEHLRTLVPSLKEEVRSLKEALVRYEKMEEYLAECGMLVR